MEAHDADYDGTCRIRDKQRLRLLDACLQALENAHERDEVTVSADLAVRLRRHLPLVAPRMKIAEALDIVFREQGKHLLSKDEEELWTEREVVALQPSENDEASAGILRLFGAGAADEAPTGRTRAWQPLDETGAKELTDEIRRASRQVSVLLLEAHERYAWSALGYRTWEQYVKREFGLSRTRSYELLDQGRVNLAIKIVSGSTEMPDISAYAALQIKPHIDEVLDIVRVRTAGMHPRQVPETITAVVEEFRARLARPPAGRAAPETDRDDSIDLGRLRAAIDYLAGLPPAADAVARLPAGELSKIRGAAAASRWLSNFAAACEERRQEQRGAAESALIARTVGMHGTECSSCAVPACQLCGADSAVANLVHIASTPSNLFDVPAPEDLPGQIAGHMISRDSSVSPANSTGADV